MKQYLYILTILACMGLLYPADAAVDLVAGQGTSITATKETPAPLQAWVEDDVRWIKSEAEHKKP